MISDDAILNLEEASRFCGLTQPTFKDRINRLRDSELAVPIESLGTNGRAYQFRAGALRAWLERYLEAEQSERRRREQQTALLFGDDELPADPMGLALKQRSELLQQRIREARLAQELGQLVAYEDAAGAIAAMAGAMKDALTALEDNVDRGLGCSEAQRVILQTLVTEARQSLAERVAEIELDEPTTQT